MLAVKGSVEKISQVITQWMLMKEALVNYWETVMPQMVLMMM